MPLEKGFDILDDFIDRLVRSKESLQGLGDEVTTQIKQDLKDSLERRINAAVVAKLPPEKLVEFEKILDKKGPKQIQEFCQKNVPDLAEFIAAELLIFQQTYLGA